MSRAYSMKHMTILMQFSIQFVSIYRYFCLTFCSRGANPLFPYRKARSTHLGSQPPVSEKCTAPPNSQKGAGGSKISPFGCSTGPTPTSVDQTTIVRFWGTTELIWDSHCPKGPPPAAHTHRIPCQLSLIGVTPSRLHF